ncbi:MAG: class I SAM-dependent methyltransferase [Bacteroidota bacterium]
MCVQSHSKGFTAWLSRKFYPWMLQHNTLYEEFMGQRKQKLFKNLSGVVIEIGAGTGANFPYFEDEIEYVGIEPHEQIREVLKSEVSKRHFKSAKILNASAEYIPLEDNTADVVISTLVLCSVPNVNATLKEIHRILKTGGRLIFVEHIAAHEDTFLLKMQKFVKPVWRKLIDNCHPDRRTDIALKSAGFKSVNFEEFTVPIPVVSPHIAGIAVK